MPLLALLSLIFFHTACSVVEADTISLSEIYPSIRNEYFDAGLGFYQYDYREELSLPHKSTEKGLVKTLSVSYRLPFGESYFLHGSLNIGGTGTVYDGSTQSGVPVQSETGNLFISPELLVGSNLLATESNQLNLYTGVSFRFWKRDIQGAGGFCEDYTTWTLPLGVQFQTFLSDNFSIAPDFSLRLMAGDR